MLEIYQEIKKTAPTIYLEENYGSSLLNYIFTDKKGNFEIGSFFLSCLKHYLESNAINQEMLSEDIEDYLSQIEINEELDIDFKKKVSTVSMDRANIFFETFNSIEINFKDGKRYISYIDNMYEHFGVLETEEYYYAFFRLLG